jgi:TonB family protein
MLYYETSDHPGRLQGAIAAVVYIAVWVVLMFVASFTIEARDDAGEGILIDFGDSESGSGTMNQSATSSAQPVTVSPDELMTQDIEEATVVREQVKSTPTPVVEERKVNQKALFPGRATDAAQGAEGVTTGSGNQGRPEGAAGGSHDGTGLGSGGHAVNLAGRSVAGSLPEPVYGTNKSGKVVITITVRPDGTVINPRYNAVGSTTNDSELVRAAIKAASGARFNEIEGEELQTGSITYNFKLK